MVGVGELPSYDNIENLTQGYYGQCLQSHIESIEVLLDEGLSLDVVKSKTIGVEFELEDLFKMDGLKRIEMLSKGVSSAIYSPNEARKKLNMTPKEGGNSPYLQQQNYSLEALAKRDANDPFLQNNAPNSLDANSTNDSSNDSDSESDDDIQEMTLSLLNSIKKGLSHEV
jgi:phage portal protein BeeE